ncbi:MAG: zinc-ribbon domain containing protein [Clostridia bacterium]|nr:zinc-ribbon domain containing protein [Clostridia bacterium]
MKKKQEIFTQCLECGEDFSITADEQLFYEYNGLCLPKRCKNCRKKRKDARKEQEKLLQEKISAEKKEREEKELALLLKSSAVKQVDFGKLENNNPSVSLFVIGNGFDIMHGVPSSYWDFQKTLGKKSELRFHLENYLDIDADKLWYNFEDSLSHINAGIMLDVMDMWLDNFDVYRNNADSMADLHAAIDTAMLPMQIITEQLPKRFRSWVESLSASGKKPCVNLLSPEALYLNFNYTDFLEQLYGVPKSRINYIHGCRRKEKYRPKEQLVLGHVPNVDYLKEYSPDPAMVPAYKNKRKRAILDYAIETGIRQWVAYYEEVFTKHTPDIIKDNISFFKNAYCMEDIFVIGHSLSKVDYPYFREIVKYNDNKAFWHIGYHGLADFKNVLAFVREMGIKDGSFEIFRT